MNHTTMRTVSVFDPAIDKSKSKLADFIRDRDMKHLGFQVGKSPTVYTLRMIPPRLFLRFVSEGTSAPDTARRAFQVGVIAVEGLRLPSGERAAKWLPTGKVELDGTEIPIVSDADLETFVPSDVLEIGGVSERASFLGKTSGSIFGLPPSCVGLLDLLTRRTVVTPEPDGSESNAAP